VQRDTKKRTQKHSSVLNTSDLGGRALLPQAHYFTNRTNVNFCHIINEVIFLGEA